MINWSPTPGEEVAQNVRFLLRTEPGTVPLSRALGVPQDVVDAPQSAAGAQLRAAISRTLKSYEPRVAAKRITVEATKDGVLTATVEIA